MQHLEFITMSFPLHHMLGSCSEADGQKVATMSGTPSRTISHQGGKERKHTYTF